MIFLYIIQIFICIALVALVTTSEKEEGGLGSSVGGGSGSRGRYKAGYEEQRDRLTQYIAIAFFVFSLFIARFS